MTCMLHLDASNFLRSGHCQDTGDLVDRDGGGACWRASWLLYVLNASCAWYEQKSQELGRQVDIHASLLTCIRDNIGVVYNISTSGKGLSASKRRHLAYLQLSSEYRSSGREILEVSEQINAHHVWRNPCAFSWSTERCHIQPLAIVLTSFTVPFVRHVRIVWERVSISLENV